MKRFRDTNYFVSENGVVINNKTNKTLNNHKNRYGYLYNNLIINGKEQKHANHRLVAECYLPKVEGKSQINHKDGNKANNHVSNLEWCNRSENQKHAYDYKLQLKRFGDKHPLSKPILDTFTGIYYVSKRETSKALNITERMFCVRMKSNYLGFRDRFIYA